MNTLLYPILAHINEPQDLKKLSVADLLLLSGEIRHLITQQVSEKGGHLGASLGATDLAVALHYVFDSPTDAMIWDVGHQAYAHKILTGRKDQFSSIRQFQGLSGFPSHKESSHDPFSVGHSSTSISAILGMAQGKKLKKDKSYNIAIIGDGALTGGMAFEALNQIAELNSNTLVLLNDNQMSIDPNVGALSTFLTDPEQAASFFKAFNLPYVGIVDGHNLGDLIGALKAYQVQGGPMVLHIKTLKGKGYQPAEKGNQTQWHAPGLFNFQTGKIEQNNNTYVKFQEVFGRSILALAKADDSVVAVTPAMISGASLNEMQKVFPDRVFDVGIAEQHAVTFAAGLAKSGLKVFCHLYATFSQRAIDQIIHDVALQNLPLIIPMDRSGIVGEDGPTHHGMFDLALLKSVPNTIITSARNEIELRNLLFTAYQNQHPGPFIIRYPRGNGKMKQWEQAFEAFPLSSFETLKEGGQLLIISHGTIINNILESIQDLDETTQQKISLINLRFLKPLNTSAISAMASKHQSILFIEDLYASGSMMESILPHLPSSLKTAHLHLPETFIPHGKTQQLLDSLGLSNKDITQKIQSILN